MSSDPIIVKSTPLSGYYTAVAQARAQKEISDDQLAQRKAEMLTDIFVKTPLKAGLEYWADKSLLDAKKPGMMQRAITHQDLSDSELLVPDLSQSRAQRRGERNALGKGNGTLIGQPRQKLEAAQGRAGMGDDEYHTSLYGPVGFDEGGVPREGYKYRDQISQRAHKTQNLKLNERDDAVRTKQLNLYRLAQTDMPDIKVLKKATADTRAYVEKFGADVTSGRRFLNVPKPGGVRTGKASGRYGKEEYIKWLAGQTEPIEMSKLIVMYSRRKGAYADWGSLSPAQKQLKDGELFAWEQAITEYQQTKPRLFADITSPTGASFDDHVWIPMTEETGHNAHRAWSGKRALAPRHVVINKAPTHTPGGIRPVVKINNPKGWSLYQGKMKLTGKSVDIHGGHVDGVLRSGKLKVFSADMRSITDASLGDERFRHSGETAEKADKRVRDLLEKIQTFTGKNAPTQAAKWISKHYVDADGNLKMGRREPAANRALLNALALYSKLDASTATPPTKVPRGWTADQGAMLQWGNKYIATGGAGMAKNVTGLSHLKTVAGQEKFFKAKRKPQDAFIKAEKARYARLVSKNVRGSVKYTRYFMVNNEIQSQPVTAQKGRFEASPAEHEKWAKLQWQAKGNKLIPAKIDKSMVDAEVQARTQELNGQKTAFLLALKENIKAHLQAESGTHLKGKALDERAKALLDKLYSPKSPLFPYLPTRGGPGPTGMFRSPQPHEAKAMPDGLQEHPAWVQELWLYAQAQEGWTAARKGRWFEKMVHGRMPLQQVKKEYA